MVAGVAETKEPEAAMTPVTLVTVVAAKTKDLEAAMTVATAAAVTLVTAAAVVLVGVLISSTIASSANRSRRRRRVSAMTAAW